MWNYKWAKGAYQRENSVEIMIQLISRKLLNESLRLSQISHTRNEYEISTLDASFNYSLLCLFIILSGCWRGNNFFCRLFLSHGKRNFVHILKHKIKKETRHIFSATTHLHIFTFWDWNDREEGRKSMKKKKLFYGFSLNAILWNASETSAIIKWSNKALMK